MQLVATRRAKLNALRSLRFKQAQTLGCLCQQCPHYRSSKHGPVIPKATLKPSKTKLVAIGEAPGETEEIQNEFFVGASGDRFDLCLSRYGINRRGWHFTNAVLCRSEEPVNQKESTRCCSPRLQRELKGLGAKWALALGGLALHVLTGKPDRILSWMGGPLEALEDFGVRYVLPALHPAFVLRPDGRAYSAVLAVHIARAFAFATNRLRQFEWPEAVIEPGAKALKALKEIAASPLPIAIDTETRGTDAMLVPNMAMGLGNRELAVSLPWDAYVAARGESVARLDEAHRSAVRKALAGQQLKVFQNAQHDILALERAGLKLNGSIFDLLVAHAVVAPGIKHDLGTIAALDLHAERWKSIFVAGAGDQKGAEKYAKRKPEVLRAYNAKDVLATALLEPALQERLGQEHNGRAIYDGHMVRAEIALKMRRRGVVVNTQHFDRHLKSLKRKRQLARSDLRKVARKVGLRFKGERPGMDAGYNPNAKAHASRLFFKVFKVKPTKWSEETGAPSLDAEVLTELLRHPNAIVAFAARRQLVYRKWRKLSVDYIERLPMYDDRTVHPVWNPVGARTHRWAASSPNLMNVPEDLRDLFRGRGRYVVAGDYDQLELRILAALSQDVAFLETFAKGGDPHRDTAALMFNKPARQVTDDERKLAKPFNYGCVTLDTQALTRNGWKFYKDLSVGDEILTYNPQMGFKEWAPILHLTYHKSAEVIEMSSGGKNFTVRTTPDHRWFVRQRTKSGKGYASRPYMTDCVKTTSEINTESNIIMNAPMVPDVQSSGPVTLREEKYGPDWAGIICGMASVQRRAFLIGFLLADVHWVKPKIHNGKSGVWVWAQNSGNIAEAVIAATFIEHGGAIYLADRTDAPKPMVTGRLSIRPHITAQRLTKKYIGKHPVWCPTTKNGSWIMRRGNTITITGNCGYGGGADELHAAAVVDFPDITLDYTRRLLKMWVKAHPDIIRWQERSLVSARKLQYVEAPLSGHRMHFFGEPKSTEVYNYPVQHTAADLINEATPLISEQLNWTTEGIMAQVHDSLVLDGNDPKRLEALLRSHMEVTQLGVPFTITVKRGLRSWGACR